jgi:hypothetical protein
MSTSRVALDSNCLSYLLDGIYAVTGPIGDLAEEQLALVRTMFYDEWPFYVTAVFASSAAGYGTRGAPICTRAGLIAWWMSLSRSTRSASPRARMHF